MLHRDNNGFLKLSGHSQFSLGFDYKYDSGNGLANRNGYRAGFKAESLHPALFYTGSFEVTDFGNMGPVPKQQVT
ncbi:hypothetical protein [Rufibacter latericius]|uniref:Type IX secretion system membrane protein PorP/SprF n=1 Tax=Rufibacter latericius TaxID=2487040 RepID=A0A3M9MAZ8_9BACT|nr:hypothetical protein [Rufibacter latericius]RNI22033.1 hypothetical protein EFB08_23155 [Rufibacter latericius]